MASQSEGEECQTRAICMQAYDLDVVHRAGATNANADSLSRTDFQQMSLLQEKGGGM